MGAECRAGPGTAQGTAPRKSAESDRRHRHGTPECGSRESPPAPDSARQEPGAVELY